MFGFTFVPAWFMTRDVDRWIVTLSDVNIWQAVQVCHASYGKPAAQKPANLLLVVSLLWEPLEEPQKCLFSIKLAYKAAALPSCTDMPDAAHNLPACCHGS
jgi:hypothetical protein